MNGNSQCEENQYEFCDRVGPGFFRSLGLDWDLNAGIVTCHGDKCYGYRSYFIDNGVPFNHGVMIYLITYLFPYSKEVRATSNGWVDPKKWIVENYHKFKSLLDR